MNLSQYGIEIFFEDAHLIVLSKPAGLLSQGDSGGEVSLVDLLRDYFGRPYVGLVHRLDRNTSGIMVVAKRTKAASRLTGALQRGEIQRTYLAWTMGKIPNSNTWFHLLNKDERTNVVKVVRSGGKEAILAVKPLTYSFWNQMPCTLAEFSLETGRSHQIRVQAAHEGFPLLGDVKYGSKHKPKLGALSSDFPRVALHSHRLEFQHPVPSAYPQSGMSFIAPLPSPLLELLPSHFRFP